jgi:hypothetical protein
VYHTELPIISLALNPNGENSLAVGFHNDINLYKIIFTANLAESLGKTKYFVGKNF